MVVYRIEDELKLWSVTANSFPHDIGEAFQRLVKLLKGTDGRVFFGISYLSDAGEIIYKAAVLESYPGEGELLHLDPYRVEKGNYLSETVFNWRKNPDSIGMTFKKMAGSAAHAVFPFLEWYHENDVTCMIRLDDEVSPG